MKPSNIHLFAWDESELYKNKTNFTAVNFTAVIVDAKPTKIKWNIFLKNEPGK